MREWFVIENVAAYAVFGGDLKKVSGYIPREIAEQICGRALDGNVWFTREESEKIHTHSEWSDTDPRGPARSADGASQELPPSDEQMFLRLAAAPRSDSVADQFSSLELWD